MRLNDIRPGAGARTPRKRRGRGIGSGLGKTGGRGHKGQRARAGSGPRPGFEGGQMPLHRRLPKFGFKSRKAATTGELGVGMLANLEADVVDLATLVAAGYATRRLLRVKLIAGGGELNRAVTVRGLAVSSGAREAIEKAGGSIEP